MKEEIAKLPVSSQVEMVERNYQLFYLQSQSILRNIHRLKIKSERLGRTFRQYSKEETPGFGVVLDVVGEVVEETEEARQLLYDRLHVKWMTRIGHFEEETRKIKAMCHEVQQLKIKLDAQTRKLNELQNKGATAGKKYTQMKTDHSVMANVVAEKTKELEDSFGRFNEKKLRDMQAMLGDLSRAYVSYHAQCLEAWSDAVMEVESLDVDAEAKDALVRLNPQSVVHVNGDHAAQPPAQDPKLSRQSTEQDRQETRPRGASSASLKRSGSGTVQAQSGQVSARGAAPRVEEREAEQGNEAEGEEESSQRQRASGRTRPPAYNSRLKDRDDFDTTGDFESEDDDF
eukprot:GCRY01003093.1.p1 GENE.GCRY01003093.1~~GCRY01003093.1.p1  ORF type:complete len:344 (+),score=55.44 GCRY01003093.1:118-1149(+)